MANNDDNYETILNSDKPDNKLEFFWLTFKDSIKNYLNVDEYNEMVKLSDKLNLLQKEEKYVEIEEYIKSHIERIGYSMMALRNTYKLSHLETNIKRWCNLSGKDIYSKSNTFYCLLLIYLNLHKANKNKQEDVEKMFKCISDFSVNRNNDLLLTELMNLSIKNKMYGNIDKLRNIIDIELFIDKDKTDKDNKSDAYIKTTGSQKLSKYLIPFEY